MVHRNWQEEMQIRHWEEVIVDQEDVIYALQKDFMRAMSVVGAARILTNIEPAVVECMIEATYYPSSDPTRTKQVAGALDNLFKAVKDHNQKPGAADTIQMTRDDGHDVVNALLMAITKLKENRDDPDFQQHRADYQRMIERHEATMKRLQEQLQ